MAAIGWNALMSVGVDEFDADHRTLVDLINDLHRSIGDDEEYATLGSVLQALEDYAQHHFAREETVLAAVSYPGLAGHVAAHHDLFSRVTELKEHYDQDRTSVRAKDCLVFLHKWLIEHICSTDMDYRSYVVGRADPTQLIKKVSMTGGRGGGAVPLDWKRLKLLVVDDNRNFCQVMRTILEGVGGKDIAIAFDLAAGREALESTPFDLLVTDWHVGSESGLDLVSWVRRHPKLATLPVLILSGHERLANRDVALGAGADEFMEKPISARGLLICLGRLLARRQPLAG